MVSYSGVLQTLVATSLRKVAKQGYVFDIELQLAMAFMEMDHNFIKAIHYMHSSSSESQNHIRYLLNEAIKTKYGPEKEIGPYVNLSSVLQEYPVISTANPIEALKDDLKDLGSSSDNELELDLLKEDLLCVVCKGMGVGRRNRLVECLDCHNLYHQECHDPPVSDEDTEASGISGWYCAACKDVQASKAAKKSAQSPVSNIAPSHTGSRSPPNTTQNNQVLAPTKQYEKESSEMGSSKLSGSKSSSSSSSTTSSKSSSASNRVMTPNINLVSADKRLQIMKKKAAKLQEKRKLPR